MVSCRSTKNANLKTEKGSRADNDMFHHLNNPIYGVLFDSIINDYLIKHCGYNTSDYPRTALVANTYCDCMYADSRALTMSLTFTNPATA